MVIFYFQGMSMDDFLKFFELLATLATGTLMGWYCMGSFVLLFVSFLLLMIKSYADDGSWD
jgi:hypothetical protein